MHILKLAAGAFMLLCAGCGLFPVSSTPHPALLPRDDADFSKSLAHFAHGIILEGELGRSGDAAALDAFRQASALAATNAILADLVVGRLWNQGRHDDALEELQQRCRRHPSEAAHALLASLADALGRDELAAEHFGRAAAYGSAQMRRWQAYQVRAWIKAEQDRRALSVLRRLALPQRGRNADMTLPLFWGQQILQLKTGGVRARPYFDLALQSATNGPQRAVAYEGLAGVELLDGRTNAARRAMGQAVRQAPSDPERVMNLMRFEFAVTGLGVTNDWLRAAAADNPDVTALLALAQIALARRDREAACRLFETARRELDRAGTRPLAEGFYTQYGNLLDEAGRTSEAEALLLEAIHAHPDSALLQNHLAYFWAVHNVRLDEAELLVKRALARHPDNGAFLDTLGWVYYRQGRYDAALEQLLLAARTEGEDPTVLDHIGDVYFALGRRAEALAFWRRSLRIRPDDASVAEKIRRHDDEKTP